MPNSPETFSSTDYSKNIESRQIYHFVFVFARLTSTVTDYANLALVWRELLN